MTWIFRDLLPDSDPNMEDLTYDCNNWTVPVNLSTHPVGSPSQGLPEHGATQVNTLEVQVYSLAHSIFKRWIWQLNEGNKYINLCFNERENQYYISKQSIDW